MLRSRPAAGALALALSLLGSLGCVSSPSSRTTSSSTAPVTLNGFDLVGGESITVQAVDQNTGQLVKLGTATSADAGMQFSSPGGSYTLYPWSFDAGVLGANYWAPQTIQPNLASSQGHLEIFASDINQTFKTFSAPAWQEVLSSNLDPVTAGRTYTDGLSTVLFDQRLGAGAASTWTPLLGGVLTPPSGNFSKVAWTLGSYSVQGNTTYAFICAPEKSGTHPVVVYNHGGLATPSNPGVALATGGNLNGELTAAGWTTQPYAGSVFLPDELGQCVDWAKRGWIAAMASYRGETVDVQYDSGQPAYTATSPGGLELCLGQVTDVLALTDMVVNHGSSVTVGTGAGAETLSVDTTKVLMYGYSHGGCITYRAVEQGAPVTAFAVIEGIADMNLGYLDVLATGQPPAQAALAAGAYDSTGTVPYLPDAAHVMGYNWRSPHYFGSRGDLSIQRFKSMPILIVEGDADTTVGLDQAAEMAGDIGATNYYVGPSGTAPASVACMPSPVGAPIPSSATGPWSTCPLAFAPLSNLQPCWPSTPGGASFTSCAFTYPTASPHQMFVFHNMDHTNGGVMIYETFRLFVEENLGLFPGCNGLTGDCATDP